MVLEYRLHLHALFGSMPAWDISTNASELLLLSFMGFGLATNKIVIYAGW
jgi:hypothetical protein